MFLCSFEVYAPIQTHARRKRHNFLRIQSVRGTKVFMGLDVFFLQSAGCYISTITKENQQCYLSGLAHFNDGEEGKVTVSFSAHTSCPSMALVG